VSAALRTTIVGWSEAFDVELAFPAPFEK